MATTMDRARCFRMIGPTKENGIITRCTEREFISSLTSGATKEHSNLTISKAKVSSPTTTESFSLANSRKTNPLKGKVLLKTKIRKPATRITGIGKTGFSAEEIALRRTQ